jgi:hypothetical protein
MKKLLLLIVAALTYAVGAVAQGAPEISFEKLVHDFGTFPEESGKVSCTFEFTNTGSADLVLQKVKASCGCTTPEWTKTPIKPGEKGNVTATYNASGRPGNFTKTITVTTNAGDKRLTIKGEVVPKAAKVEDQYPVNMNGLRIKKQHVYLNNIKYPANSRTERIAVVNDTKEDMTVSFKNVPSYIVVKAIPEKLKAGEKGTIDVTMETKSSNVWGSFSQDFNVLVNGKGAEDKANVISVHGNVVEDFSALTPEEKAQAPVLKVANVVNLGTLKANTKKNLKFSFNNAGKGSLYVRSISSDSKAIEITAPSKPIKAGKKEDVKFSIDTKGLVPGKFSYRVTMITNDPNNSVVTLQLTGEIK